MHENSPALVAFCLGHVESRRSHCAQLDVHTFYRYICYYKDVLPVPGLTYAALLAQVHVCRSSHKDVLPVPTYVPALLSEVPGRPTGAYGQQIFDAAQTFALIGIAIKLTPVVGYFHFRASRHRYHRYPAAVRGNVPVKKSGNSSRIVTILFQYCCNDERDHKRMARTPSKRAKPPATRAGAPNTEVSDAEPAPPSKRPKPTAEPRKLCRVPMAASPSLDLRRALLRLAENRFILYSGDGPEKTAMRIISQVFNGDARKSPGFNADLKDGYEGWGKKTSPKYPKKSNEDALLHVYKQWFSIYLSKIKTQWLQCNLPNDDLDKLEDVEDMVVLLSRKTYEAALVNILYADGTKGQLRTKDAASAKFNKAFKVR